MGDRASKHSVSIVVIVKVDGKVRPKWIEFSSEKFLEHGGVLATIRALGITKENFGISAFREDLLSFDIVDFGKFLSICETIFRRHLESSDRSEFVHRL